MPIPKQTMSTKKSTLKKHEAATYKSFNISIVHRIIAPTSPLCFRATTDLCGGCTCWNLHITMQPIRICLMFPSGVASLTLTFLQLHNSNIRVKDEFVDWLGQIIDNQAHGCYLARGLLPVGSMPSLCVQTGELYENSSTMNISISITGWRLILLIQRTKKCNGRVVQTEMSSRKFVQDPSCL